MRFFLYIVLVMIPLSFFAQEDSLFIKREQKLQGYLNDLRSSKNNEERQKNNNIFKDYLYETLQLKGVFDYPFSDLKTLGSVKSPDNSFRLFNWNVEQDDHSNLYYCFILHFDEKKKEWKTIELVDNSNFIQKRSEDILDEKNWYGALYYKVIPVKKSNKILYTLLGWNGNNSMSNIKLVDVLSFSGNHVKLGSPIFKMKDGLHKRLFFEYSDKAFMSLNYDETRERIVYDHLSPESPTMEGLYEYYVPDLSYDELKFVNNKWLLQENVVGVNGKESKSYDLYHIDDKNGKVVKTQTKNKWIDPTDGNAPAGANVHVAKLPEDDINDKKKSETENVNQEPKINKKNSKSEFSMNPFLKKKRK